VWSAEIGYIEYRFHLFDKLASPPVDCERGVRRPGVSFRHRFVLSLALSSLPMLGLRMSGLNLVSADPLRATALLYAAFVAASHLAAPAADQGALSRGLPEPGHQRVLRRWRPHRRAGHGLAYLAGLLSLCGARHRPRCSPPDALAFRALRDAVWIRRHHLKVLEKSAA